MKTIILATILMLAACAGELQPQRVTINEGYRLTLSENEITICSNELRQASIYISRSATFRGKPIHFSVPSTLPRGITFEVSGNPILGDTLMMNLMADTSLIQGVYSVIISSQSNGYYPSKGVILRIKGE